MVVVFNQFYYSYLCKLLSTFLLINTSKLQNVMNVTFIGSNYTVMVSIKINKTFEILCCTFSGTYFTSK